MRSVTNKTNEQIVGEWDALAELRFEQISSGSDITFNKLIAPQIIGLADGERSRIAVDAGCGVGILTNMLNHICGSITGIDPSGVSIDIAKSRFGANCAFDQSTLEEYSKHTSQIADIVFANMVLMDVLDLDSFLGAVANILSDRGVLIFSITHPCFWPTYYGYDNESWYSYSKEIIVESPFRITAQPNCHLLSTHIHRPVEQYIRAFRKAGLAIEVLLEPMPNAETEILYPSRWKSPRYIVGKCRKYSNS